MSQNCLKTFFENFDASKPNTMTCFSDDLIVEQGQQFQQQQPQPQPLRRQVQHRYPQHYAPMVNDPVYHGGYGVGEFAPPIVNQSFVNSYEINPIYATVSYAENTNPNMSLQASQQQQGYLHCIPSSQAIAQVQLGRSGSLSSQESLSNDSISELNKKLQIKREKNRLAARKCRNKKINLITQSKREIEKLKRDIELEEQLLRQLNARRAEMRCVVIQLKLMLQVLHK